MLLVVIAEDEELEVDWEVTGSFLLQYVPSCLPNFTITEGGFELVELIELPLVVESLVSSELGLLEIPLVANEGDDLFAASSFNWLCVEVEFCEFP